MDRDAPQQRHGGESERGAQEFLPRHPMTFVAHDPALALGGAAVKPPLRRACPQLSSTKQDRRFCCCRFASVQNRKGRRIWNLGPPASQKVQSWRLDLLADHGGDCAPLGLTFQGSGETHMHGRSFFAVSVAGGLALAYAVIVPVAAVAEDVAAAEQPATPTGATTPAPSPSRSIAGSAERGCAQHQRHAADRGGGTGRRRRSGHRKHSQQARRCGFAQGRRSR